MIDPEVLADRLESCELALRTYGELTWERVDAWSVARMPTKGERGGGIADGADDDDRIDDRREDAAAARYHTELTTLTARIDADLHRLRRIINICNPAVPQSLATKDMLIAQVAADGWCVSCWRADQHLSPVAERRYRDRCRFCGDYHRDQQEDPPIDILRARIDGRPIRVKV